MEEFIIFYRDIYKARGLIFIMGEYLFKVHKSYRLVVAVCDKELYGRKLEEGVKALDLTGQFFEGDEVSEVELKEKLIEFAKEDATFNIVGPKSVGIAQELEIVGDGGVVEIDGVPFALVLL